MSSMKETPGDEINGGFIITGGGAMIKDLVTLGEFIFLKDHVELAFLFLGGMTNVMKNPKYSTVLGLLKEASKNTEGKSRVGDKSTI